jgi:hypothetical protein
MSNQGANTIVLNATGNQLDGTIANALYIAPIRNVNTLTNGFVQYNTGTNEVVYNSATGVNQGDYLYFNGTSWVVGNTRISLGQSAGTTSQGTNAVAVGYAAGSNSQGASAVAIGYLAGQSGQVANSIALNASGVALNPALAGLYVAPIRNNSMWSTNTLMYNNITGEIIYNSTSVSGTSNIVIGQNAGASNQGANATAVGNNAGAINQGANAVAMGNSAGESNQGAGATAVGAFAGQYGQGAGATAFGLNAGNSNQGANAVAMGNNAGANNQGAGAAALGANAGQYGQGAGALAFGSNAGNSNQGASAVAIGNNAGVTNQGNNSIIINATGSALNQTTANTFTVKPVRAVTSVTFAAPTAGSIPAGFSPVYYNPTTGELIVITP